MDRNDRFTFSENGEVLTPKIGTWQNPDDGELYDLVQSEHWNRSDFADVEIVEVWVYDRLTFLGYIIKPTTTSATQCMKEFLNLYRAQNWNERARGVNQLPVILCKDK